MRYGLFYNTPLVSYISIISQIVAVGLRPMPPIILEGPCLYSFILKHCRFLLHYHTEIQAFPSVNLAFCKKKQQHHQAIVNEGSNNIQYTAVYLFVIFISSSSQSHVLCVMHVSDFRLLQWRDVQGLLPACPPSTAHPTDWPKGRKSSVHNLTHRHLNNSKVIYLNSSMCIWNKLKGLCVGQLWKCPDIWNKN